MADNFRNFSIACDRFAAKMKLGVTTVQKRIAFDLYGRIIAKTPVDTGRARASWTIASGSPDRTVAAQGGLPAPQIPLGLLVKPGETIWIANNLPYITALEDGHSKQAPSGMVALSIEEIRLKMRALISEGLRDANL